MSFPVEKPTASAYWLHGVTVAASALPRTAHTVVIGAGITGASLAYHLSRQPAAPSSTTSTPPTILVVDARDVGGGATGRNGGLLWPGLTDSWSTLVSKHGAAAVRGMEAFDHATCAAVVEYARRHLGDGQAAQVVQALQGGGLHLVESEERLSRWRAEVALMHAAGCGAGMEVWDADRVRQVVPGTQAVGGVHSSVAYMVRSASLAQSLLQTAVTTGRVRYASHTLVKSVTRSGPSLTVHTQHGDIAARRVVYCTNAYTASLLPAIDVTPVRNQVVVTDPVRAGLFSHTAVSAHDGYEYMSQRPDHRIVLGGLRYLGVNSEVGTSDDANLDPNVSQALAEWAGVMGWTSDGNPIVGRVPGTQNEYVCAGYSGHGMPRAYGCALALAELMTLGDHVRVDGTTITTAKMPVAFLPGSRFTTTVRPSFELRL
ncbi:FAD dependent oxidoreductase [Entophlyctis helioformis]|nr:FAD dependent oxidoreductase [Entophlyctis helioformis]